MVFARAAKHRCSNHLRPSALRFAKETVKREGISNALIRSKGINTVVCLSRRTRDKNKGEASKGGRKRKTDKKGHKIAQKEKNTWRRRDTATPAPDISSAWGKIQGE